MKRIIGLLFLAGLFITTACSNNQPAETKTEKVIVVPAPVNQAPVTNPPPKNTTIVLDKNGVKVGTKKVDVTINPPKKKDN